MKHSNNVVGGRFMRPAAIRKEIFDGLVTEWWIRRNVAPDRKVKLGHSTVGWWESDVREWLKSRQGAK